MSYKYDMSNEPKPKIKKLLPVGWREFSIINCKEAKSKSGNDMFIFSIQDVATGYEEDIYAIATPGKRWFLKSLLSGAGCVAAADGVYEWDLDDVIGHNFMGLVEHEPNSYINRDGEKVETTQHRISDIKAVDKINPEEIAWDDEKK